MKIIILNSILNYSKWNNFNLIILVSNIIFEIISFHEKQLKTIFFNTFLLLCISNERLKILLNIKWKNIITWANIIKSKQKEEKMKKIENIKQQNMITNKNKHEKHKNDNEW